MNIDKLKALIQKANPDIMRLQLGCFFQNHRGENFMVLKPFAYMPGQEQEFVCIQEGHIGTLRYTKDVLELDRTIKILGRPITLDDVLITFSKANVWVDSFSLNGQELNIFLTDSEKKQFAIFWELGKTLDEQTEFMHHRICRALEGALAAEENL